jgi:hypothetical protein
MAADPPLTAADDDPDPWLRPPWETAPDETDSDLGRRRSVPRSGAADPLAGADPLLLATLADASDALARLDTSLAAADAAVQDGLLARLALREAAGWLAHAHTWVHPLDLALRAAGRMAAPSRSGSRSLSDEVAEVAKGGRPAAGHNPSP